MDLMFKDVDVYINKTQILNKVCGLVKQGEMLAVMGPSGAGKSTLLTALAGRSELSDGQVTLNNEPMNKQLRRKVAYVLQEDVFFANLTLKETLTYSAMLRLPDEMPHYLKTQRVQEIIDILQLDKCKNTVMGSSSVRGCSGGERKRATIALELLTNPLVLLLDEPTSGLDYAIAFDLMQIMSDYTRKTNKTVVVTIHQPSSQIFHMFTKLLLLCDGKNAYFGSAPGVLDFFSSLGLHCVPHYNPADFILEMVKKTPEITESVLQLARKCRKTEWPLELRSEYVKVEKQSNGFLRRLSSSINLDPSVLEQKDSNSSISRTLSNGLNGISIIKEEPEEPEIIVNRSSGKRNSIVETDLQMELFMDRDCKWPTGFMTQFRVLNIRTLKQARHRILSKLQLFQAASVTIFAAILWFQTDRSEETLRDRMGALFFTIVYWGFMAMLTALNAFPDERPVINRERAAGTYRLTAYYLAKQTSELPLTCLLPVVYTVLVYWSIGLQESASSFFLYLFCNLFFAFSMQGMGMMLGCCVKDYGKTLTIGMVFMLLSMLAGGYYQRHMKPWAVFLKYLSIVNYAYQPLLYNEFGSGDPLICLPANQTFFDSCHNNTMVSGEEVLATLDVIPNWINYVMLLVFCFGTRIAGYFFLRYVDVPQ